MLDFAMILAQAAGDAGIGVLGKGIGMGLVIIGAGLGIGPRLRKRQIHRGPDPHACDL